MVNQLVVTLVNSILGVGNPTSRGNYAYKCPFCNHHKPKLEINFDEDNDNFYQKWNCWVCHTKGTKIISLFKKLNIHDEKIYELKSLTNSNFKLDVKVKEFDKIELPKEYLPILNNNNFHAKRALKYLQSRGITNEDIIKYNIGYCEEGKYEQCIIIPSYNSLGELNYFIARSFNPGSYRKYQNPPFSKNIIPFELFINWNSPLILCEGVFDAISIKRNAIPLLGNSIQDELMKKIVTSKIKQIFIILDNDMKKLALKYAEDLFNEGKEVFLIDLNKKDPNKIGFQAILKYIQNATPLTTYSLLSKKLEL
jgi:DNA primase